MISSRPHTTDVLPLAQAYYDRHQDEMGGRLHVVLDDHNAEDGWIESARERCEAAGDGDGVLVCDLLLAMPYWCRVKVCRKVEFRDL